MCSATPNQVFPLSHFESIEIYWEAFSTCVVHRRTMSSKEDFKDDYKDGYEGKYGEGKDDSEEKDIYDNYDKPAPPTVNVTAIRISPANAELTSALKLDITFELDRDAIAAHWEIKFLVDCTHRRIIKILGQTNVDDYFEGESDMSFSVDAIDVSGISPSTLANSGLLMAAFMVDGEEVASINMVVNVTKKDGELMREILSPLD